jgi:hypothetical protein
MILGLGTNVVVYLLIGFLHSVVTITAVSYYNDIKGGVVTYFMVGCLGVIMVVWWVVTMPMVFFSALAWYISENLGQ